MLTQHFIPQSAKFQNNAKNDPPSGTCVPPGGTIFLSQIFILVISIPYLSMVKKDKWFFDGKKINFSKYQGQNFKNIELLRSKRDFFNFVQVITFAS